MKKKDRPTLSTHFTPATATLPPGRFIMEHLLGTGGVCAVFHCTDALRTIWGDGQSSLAIKKLLPDYVTNPKANLLLMQEFCLTRQLAHPNIIRVYDVHQIPCQIPCQIPGQTLNPLPYESPQQDFRQTSGQPGHTDMDRVGTRHTKDKTLHKSVQEYELAMTMELLTGPSLADLIQTYPQGMGKKMLPLAKQLLEAIHYLHSRGIAHGDIKPPNITLEPSGRLVLFDFNSAMGGFVPGFAQLTESQRLRADLRLKNVTPLYASPERIETGIPSLEDDIFTAAATLYHLAYGTRPHVAENALVARQTGQTPREPLFMLPKAMHKLLCKALSFNPAARPRSGDWLQAFDTRTMRALLPNVFKRLLWPPSNPHV